MAGFAWYLVVSPENSESSHLRRRVPIARLIRGAMGARLRKRDVNCRIDSIEGQVSALHCFFSLTKMVQRGKVVERFATPKLYGHVETGTKGHPRPDALSYVGSLL